MELKAKHVFSGSSLEINAHDEQVDVDNNTLVKPDLQKTGKPF